MKLLNPLLGLALTRNKLGHVHRGQHHAHGHILNGHLSQGVTMMTFCSLGRAQREIRELFMCCSELFLSKHNTKYWDFYWRWWIVFLNTSNHQGELTLSVLSLFWQAISLCILGRLLLKEVGINCLRKLQDQDFYAFSKVVGRSQNSYIYGDLVSALIQYLHPSSQRLNRII